MPLPHRLRADLMVPAMVSTLASVFSPARRADVMRMLARPSARWSIVIALGALVGATSVVLGGRGNANPMIGFAIPVALAGLFAMLVRLDWLLIVVLMTRASLEPAFLLLKGNSEGMGPGAAINAVVVLLGGLYFLRKPRAFARGHILIWLVFLSLAAAGTRYAPDPSNATRMLMVYLTYFVVFALPAALLTSRKDVGPWLTVLLIASVVPTLMGLFDMATGGVKVGETEVVEGADMLAMSMPEYSGFRIQGAFNHPNIYAFFLITLICVVLYALRSGWFDRIRHGRLLGLGYLALQGVLLLATQTRGAWAGAGIMLLAYAMFIDRRFLVYMALAAVALGFVPIVQDRIVEILGAGPVRTDDALNSYEWRLAMWKSAWPWIQDRWLLGWGLDSYTEYSRIFFPLEFIVAFDAHNVYVQLAFELGVPAVVSFVAIFVGMMVVAARSFRRARLESVLLVSLAIAYLLACYSDNMHRYLVSNWYTFFFMGTLCVIASMPQSSNGE